jgi:hypothetical protein
MLSSKRAATSIDMEESDDHGLSKASERIISSQMDMYRGQCGVMAVEAWRMWNEFPDQHESMVLRSPLLHFGNLLETLDEIGILMSRMVVSPVLDDQFILHNLFVRPQTSSSSRFLRVCMFSAIMVKYGQTNFRYSVCGNAVHYSNIPSCCDRANLFQDLAAYVTRRRMNSL